VRHAILFIVLVLACGCGSSTGLSLDPSSLSVSGPNGDSALAIKVGTRVTLRVVVRDAAGEVVTPTRPLNFESGNRAVATVDSTGVVSAISLGSTYIVVTLAVDSRTLEDSVAVDVAAPLAEGRRP
jgi:hypothetical protein